MRALSSTPVAEPDSSQTQSTIRLLHPPSKYPIIPLLPEDLPPAPEIGETAVMRAVRGLNPASSAGPDLMSPRLLRLLTSTSITPQAGVTGLSSLTSLVRKLVQGDLPESILPVFTAATAIPIQAGPTKIRPIAIGQVLHGLVTKALLPQAIQESADFLRPNQLANGVHAGIDGLVNDTRMLCKRFERRDDFVLISVDAKNAFNTISRQKMLDILPDKAPSLARFINMVYGKCKAPLLLPFTSAARLYSCEGTQQGDPASMLLFSLVLQPVINTISQSCDLALNRWYDEDGTLIGSIEQVSRAVHILLSEGANINFQVQARKTIAFWPRISQHKIRPLTSILPVRVANVNGIELLGAPIGSESFVKT